MKYIKQLTIIFTVAFLGELLSAVLPLPVPASIYGLLLMFFLLLSGIVRLSDVQETASFLVEIMPVMFIPAAVGLVTAFDLLRAHFVAYTVMLFVSTAVVFFVSGRTTQFFIRKGKEKNHE